MRVNGTPAQSRIPFHLNDEGYKRFGELLATVGMQFLEQRREAMPALHYPIDSFRLLLVCKRITTCE